MVIKIAKQFESLKLFAYFGTKIVIDMQDIYTGDIKTKETSKELFIIPLVYEITMPDSWMGWLVGGQKKALVLDTFSDPKLVVLKDIARLIKEEMIRKILCKN